MRLLRAAILALAGILPVTGAGPPQKMYPVGGLDPEIGDALKAAVASHVRGLQPRLKAIEEKQSRVKPPHGPSYNGAHPMEYMSRDLKNTRKSNLAPKSGAETERRAAEQEEHDQIAYRNIATYEYTSDGE